MAVSQKTWISFCLTDILMVNAVCWAKFERVSLGEYRIAALSWMFRKSKIAWDKLLIASVRHILRKYGITNGVLILDESDRARSKNTKRIHKAHKQRHKASGGYVNGQTIVLLLLVTDSITVPVGFKFYMPNPAISAWASRHTAEIEFIAVVKDEILPLEVKSGTSRQKKSLIVYGEKFKPSVLFRSTLMNFKEDGKIRNYPLYAVSLFLKGL